MGKAKNKPTKALYRVHRSHDFDEVVGQEHVIKTLKTAIAENRLAHAYLFTGPRGVGKTSVARILAHTINKLPYTGEELQLDIVEIDAASNRGIDEIRELREKVHIAPSAARYKVYIIDEVHMLTTPAFNALLKTLEEPPEHVVFVLATTEPHKVPETIISRTQRFSFRPITTESIVSHLQAIAKKEQIKISSAAISLIAEHANGGLRDAIGFLDQLSGSGQQVTLENVQNLLGLAPSKQVEAILSALEGGNVKALLGQLEAAFNAGATPVQLARQLVDALRTRLRQGKTVELNVVEGLLSVNTSPQPDLKLEVVLVRACLGNSSAATSQYVATKEEPEATKPTTAAKESAKRKDAKIKAEQQSYSSEVDTPSVHPVVVAQNQWQDILNQVKTHNNSLYAILRLAKPERVEQQLLLSFAFEFHLKRADESRNKQLLEKVAGSILGENITVQTKLDKSLQTQQPQADALTSVIGVMGGGSVVEYKDE